MYMDEATKLRNIPVGIKWLFINKPMEATSILSAFGAESRLQPATFSATLFALDEVRSKFDEP